MNRIGEELFRFFFDGKKTNVYLAIIVLVAAAAVCYLVNTDPETLRHMYCTANEAQAIECTAKGWW